MANINRQQPYIPGKNVSLSNQLHETLDSLAVQHFPVSNWTVQAVNASFLTAKRFIDTVKIFTAIADEEVRRDLTAGAIAAGFYQSADVCTIKQIFEWCIWLKTPEGNATIIAALKRQFKKRALPALFIEQRAEYMQALEAKRAYYDDLLQELRRYVELVEEEKEMELHNVYVDFTPASGFDDMHDEVGAHHIDQYLGRGTNTTDLKVWAENKILHLEEVGDKKAWTFCQYMEATGGAVPEMVRTMSAARTDKARRHRPAGKRPFCEVDITNILAKRRSPQAKATSSRG